MDKVYIVIREQFSASNSFCTESFEILGVFKDKEDALIILRASEGDKCYIEEKEVL